MKLNKIFGWVFLSLLAAQACQEEIIDKTPLIVDNVKKAQNSALSNASMVAVSVNDYGTFTIQSAAGGLYIEISGNPGYNEKYKNGAKMSQYAATSAGDLWQKWQVIYEKYEGGVDYYALMNLHSGKYLDVPNSTNTSGIQLQQWEYNGSDAQLFELRELDGGYAIINKGSGLAVTNQNSSTNNGTPIVQEEYSGGSSTGEIILYQHCFFGGYAVALNPGSYNLSQLQALGVANDDVSSISIPDGFEVTFYEDDFFQGATLTRDSDGDCLVDEGWNDRMSSVMVSSTDETSADNQKWILNALPADSYRDDVVTRYFQRNDPSLGSVAWDQGSSIPLTWGSNNGKVLWVTQDAWDGDKLQPNNMFNCSDFFSYNNSIVIQQDLNDWAPDDPNMTINSPMGRPKQICSNQPGTDWSWPSNGVEIGDKVYMHCGEGVGLGLTNQSIYVLTQNSGTHWEVQRTMPTGMSGQTTINYASGMVKANDGYVYVFGTEGIGFGYYNNVHVARFPTSDPMSWTFWDGSNWTNSPVPGTGARVAEGLATIAVNYVNGKYVMMTMDNGWSCEGPRNIYMATSNSPTGPFSARVMVYKINDHFKGQYTRYYTPNIHPHFDNGRNELLITYSVNQSACDLESCFDGYIDPNYYRIRAIRVPYSKIGI